MAGVYRESRSYETRGGGGDSDSSDSDRYSKKTTVKRYKVGGSRVERVERDEIDDDRRSHYSSRRLDVGRSSQGDLLQVDSRVERSYVPERPRSAFDPGQRTTSTTVVERETIDRGRERGYYDDRDRDYRDYDRDRDRGGGDRTRVTERERIVERDRSDDLDDRGGGSRTVAVERKKVIEREDSDRWDDRPPRGDRLVYEKTKEVERERDTPLSPRGGDWDRHSHSPWDDREHETDVRIASKRVERRGGETSVEKRVVERRERDRDVDNDYRDSGPRDSTVYRKETDYYESAPVPAPIVIRERPPAPQQIILKDERSRDPNFIVIHENNEVVRRAPDPPRERERDRDRDHEDEFYYRRESREVGPYRGDRREEEYAVARWDHRDHHDRRRDRRYYGSEGDGSDREDDYYIRRTVVRKERSRSPSRHKREIAGGALAGAGIGALLGARRNGDGELQEHRGRKVVAGAAVGALAPELYKRARSAYNERFGSRSRSRSRSRSGDRHSKLKTGLGLAAAALAVAGAAKYYQTQKVEKEEMHRGRSLRRYSSEEEYHRHGSRSGSRKRSRSRVASIAKAAAGTAAVAGLVKHFRSKSRGASAGGRKRSQSRLRTGAEIVAAGLAGAGAKKLYDKHKEKKEDKERAAARSRSHSRSRGASRDSYSDDSYDSGHRGGGGGRSRSRSHSRSRFG